MEETASRIFSAARRFWRLQMHRRSPRSPLSMLRTERSWPQPRNSELPSHLPSHLPTHLPTHRPLLVQAPTRSRLETALEVRQ